MKPRLTLILLLLFVIVLAPSIALAQAKKPNILVVFGDDVGQTNVSAYTMGLMGYRTPNIDRIAKEGMIFTDYYAEQSCTAGRSSSITGQCTLRTGLSKVGITLSFQELGHGHVALDPRLRRQQTIRRRWVQLHREPQVLIHTRNSWSLRLNQNTNRQRCG